jgi:hypothetical protein
MLKVKEISLFHKKEEEKSFIYLAYQFYDPGNILDLFHIY